MKGRNKVSKDNVFISITVDDLDAREDPERSDRISVHHCTAVEIEIALGLVKCLKQRIGCRTNIVGTMSPKAWDRNHPNGEE